MSRRHDVPPMYTFRRPKPEEPKTELYTTVNVDDGNKSLERYSKYTFILLIMMFLLMIITIVYTYKKGFPVRIKG